MHYPYVHAAPPPLFNFQDRTYSLVFTKLITILFFFFVFADHTFVAEARVLSSYRPFLPPKGPAEQEKDQSLVERDYVAPSEIPDATATKHTIPGPAINASDPDDILRRKCISISLPSVVKEFY